LQKTIKSGTISFYVVYVYVEKIMEILRNRADE
jgi:hypothetical protein